MSIAWNYLDKRSAAMAALKDYRSMKAILATTAEEIANVRQDMVRIGGMRFEESAHGARNPQAGENQILHGIAEIDVLEERNRQAEEFMAWFQPAWDALGEDEKTVLTMFYLSENGKTDAIEEISERFCVERSSAYKKKDRALAHLALLLYEQEAWDGVLYFTGCALSITHRPRTYICEAAPWGSLPYDLRAVAFYHTGRFSQALEAAQAALALEPENERLRGNVDLLNRMIPSDQT